MGMAVLKGLTANTISDRSRFHTAVFYDFPSDWVYLQKTTVNNLLRRVLLARVSSVPKIAQDNFGVRIAILRHQQTSSNLGHRILQV